MSDHSAAKNDPKEIAAYWWMEFRQLFENSYGANFKTQRELETISIQKTLQHFQCHDIDSSVGELLFTYAVKPELFEDTTVFLAHIPLPVCVVSNIDTADIVQALHFHKWLLIMSLPARMQNHINLVRKCLSLLWKKRGYILMKSYT